MNLREKINSYCEECSDTSTLSLGRANQILVELSALQGNINQTILNREMKYNTKKLELLKEKGVVAKAEVVAKTTDEYKNWQEAKHYSELVVDLCRALKYFIKSQGDEYEITRNV